MKNPAKTLKLGLARFRSCGFQGDISCDVDVPAPRSEGSDSFPSLTCALVLGFPTKLTKPGLALDRRSSSCAPSRVQLFLELGELRPAFQCTGGRIQGT